MEDRKGEGGGCKQNDGQTAVALCVFEQYGVKSGSGVGQCRDTSAFPPFSSSSREAKLVGCSSHVDVRVRARARVGLGPVSGFRLD